MVRSKLFLVDNDTTYTYGDLFVRLEKDDYCKTAWQYDSLFEFLVNLVKAVYYNVDIVLLDKDFTERELETLGFRNGLHDRVEIINNNSVNVDEFRNRLYTSSAKITLFTSGTKGVPKMVCHTIKTLARMTRIGDRYSKDIWALAYNPTHMAGLQVLMQVLFNFNSAVNFFNSKLDVEKDLFAIYGVTHISATPTFYRLILNTNRVYQGVKRVTFGGERFDDSLIEKLNAVFPGAKISNIYASTELGSLLVSHGSYFQIPLEFKALIKIEKGQLMIHGSLLAEFAGNNVEWYETGDMIEWDSRGKMFKFLQRANDSINIGGYKINPYEVEDAFGRIEGVKLAYVYGRSNSVTGKILCADIVVDGEINVKEIRKHLSLTLQDYKIPRVIKKVNNLDLTRTGKLKRIS